MWSPPPPIHGSLWVPIHGSLHPHTLGVLAQAVWGAVQPPAGAAVRGGATGYLADVVDHTSLLRV